MLNGICGGISGAISILTQHVDFWSELNARIADQLEELTPNNLVKENGKIRAGLVEQSEEEWGEVESMYRQYASTVSLPRAVTKPMNDSVLRRHALPSRLYK